MHDPAQPAAPPTLPALRAQLDQLDADFVALLARRQQVVDQVASVKAAAGQAPMRDPVREAAVLDRAILHGRSLGLDGAYVGRLFREVLDQSLRRQHRTLAGSAEGDEVRVGYLGQPGSYSHVAAETWFSPDPRATVLVGSPSFEALFDALATGRVAHVVLPVENSTTGPVVEAFDLLAASALSGLPVHVIGEEEVFLDHALVGPAGLTVEDVRVVRSHPQALAQCSRFLNGLADAVSEPVRDTATALLAVADATQAAGIAAIASETAARRAGLSVLARGVANQPDNRTRFFVLGRQPVAWDPRIPCRTSVVFATPHAQGALVRCLAVFAAHAVNLTRLESRPRAGTAWDYLFHVDVEGHAQAPNVAAALEELIRVAAMVHVLGWYPARTRPTVGTPVSS